MRVGNTSILNPEYGQIRSIAWYRILFSLLRAIFPRPIPFSFYQIRTVISSELYRFREFVVFHELGHCDLGRDHRDEAFDNGVCVSIMRSGLGDCRDYYHPRTREGYLDELFDPAFWDEMNYSPPTQNL